MLTENVESTQTNITKRENLHYGYISWSAVFAGVLVAIGLSFLFNFFTLGGGLSVYTTPDDVTHPLIWGSYLWILVGGFLVLFIAGLATGAVIGCGYSLHSMNGILHGFIMWALFLVLCATLLVTYAPKTFVSIPNITTLTDMIDVPGETQQPAAEATTNQNATVNIDAPPETEVRKIGLATLATISIFLAGALGSCIGGWCGICIRRKCEVCRTKYEREI